MGRITEHVKYILNTSVMRHTIQVLIKSLYYQVTESQQNVTKKKSSMLALTLFQEVYRMCLNNSRHTAVKFSTLMMCLSRTPKLQIGKKMMQRM